MLYLNFVVSLTAVWAVDVPATPIVERVPQGPPQSTVTPTSPEYYLKTKVVEGDHWMNGLYRTSTPPLDQLVLITTSQ